MSALARSLLAALCAAIGLSALADRLDLSVAMASPAKVAHDGGNERGGGRPGGGPKG
jgi:hypothetical protein